MMMIPFGVSGKKSLASQTFPSLSLLVRSPGGQRAAFGGGRAKRCQKKLLEGQILVTQKAFSYSNFFQVREEREREEYFSSFRHRFCTVSRHANCPFLPSYLSLFFSYLLSNISISLSLQSLDWSLFCCCFRDPSRSTFYQSTEFFLFSQSGISFHGIPPPLLNDTLSITILSLSLSFQLSPSSSILIQRFFAL